MIPYNATAEVRSVIETKTPIGGIQQTEIVKYINVPVAVQPMSTLETLQYGRDATVSMHKVYHPPNYDIRPWDLIVFDGRTLRCEGAQQDQGGRGVVNKIAAREVVTG